MQHHENPLISIIVPVYNVESYLHTCLESIQKQTYENFEVILINDGSSDNSGNICDKYAKNDKRFHVFHKTNEGVSSARNLGLKKVKGEWVCFIDSDDWIEPNTLSIILHIEDSKADFIQFGYQLINPANKIIMRSNIPTQKTTLTKEEYFNTKIYHSGICGYLIKTNIIEEHKITFPDDIKFGEDQAFILKSLMCCHRILIMNEHLYNYRYREGSAMNSSMTFSRAKDHLKVILDINSFMNSINTELTFLHSYIFKQFIIRYIKIGIESTYNIYKIKAEYSIFCNKIKGNRQEILCKQFDSYLKLIYYYIRTRVLDSYIGYQIKNIFHIRQI